MFGNESLVYSGSAHMRARRPWVYWNVAVCFFCAGVLAIMLLFAYPVTYVFERGFNKENLLWMKGYFETFATHFDYWMAQHRKWIVRSNHQIGLLLPPALWLSFIVPGLLTFIGTAMNPHWSLPSHMGAARAASYRTIKKMGLFNGWLFILGRWRGKYLKLRETLTVLCMAPPGTGKTTGIVVPTILSCDRVTMIVNDVKPEIARMTSGYRETVSQVFVLQWAASDRPDLDLFYPRWNPLSPGILPVPGANRDLYIDRMVNVIVEEPKGNQDPHWTIKGRASLAGLMHFIAGKIESGSYEGIPERWQGHEPSIPMMIEWINEGIFAASKEVERLRKTDPNAAMMADPLRDFLAKAANEAMEEGYSPRAFLELNQLANTPDKERGSILSTMDGGLIVFKNSAVIARTSASDFEFIDTRGMIDPEDGKMKPLTVYLCVNIEDAKALGKITGIFIESLTAWLIAYGPGSQTVDGQKVGPCSVAFILDEFPQMPKLDALMKGPEVGRGQKVAYLLIGQDLAQVEETYGKTGVERFFANAYAKIILPVTNDQAAQRFENMIGKTTMIEKQKSRQEGLGANVNIFAANVSRNYKDHTIWAKTDFLNMGKGEQVVLIQGFHRRYIECRTPFFFEDPNYKRLVGPADGGEFWPAPPMPDWMMAKRRIEYVKEEERLASRPSPQEQRMAASAAKPSQAAPDDDAIFARIVILFTDIVAIDEDSDTAILEIAAVELQDGEVTGNNFHVFCKLDASDLSEYKEGAQGRMQDWYDSYAISAERVARETDKTERRSLLASDEAVEISERVPAFKEIAAEMVEWVHPSPVVAYNAGLEFGVLNPELIKAKQDPIPGSRIFSVIDWVRENMPPEADPSLFGLAEHFDVEATEEEHGLRFLQLLAGIYLKIEEIEINKIAQKKSAA